MWWILTLALYFQNGICTLWPKGVVHFAINKKDYDLHSQDIILSTFAEVEREVCVKFFNTPVGYNASADGRILYISNPDKRKNCPPEPYNFTANVVDMPIGYKCIHPKDITRIIVDMLRASIVQTVPTINSFDLIRKFQELAEDPSRPYLLSPIDRNFINAHYHSECGSLSQRAPVEIRRSLGAVSLSQQNEKYYKDKLWPLGILMYGVAEELRNTVYHTQLKYAMTTIELGSCVVFREVRADDALTPKNLLWFGEGGADSPQLGFVEGNQSISLQSMVQVGARGHVARVLSLLLRALAMPMVSNRPDRDNHITINWNNVEKGKEHLLEKYSIDAWIRDVHPTVSYDFDSATHAPANYACGDCRRGEVTVQPAQDHLWQRVLTMGHRADLSASDKVMLAMLYYAPCRERHTTNTNK